MTDEEKAAEADRKQKLSQIEAATVADLVGFYRQLREHKQAREKALEDELRDTKGLLDMIAGELGNRMAREGVTSMPTANGTAIRTLRQTATVKDPAVFRDFVASHGAWQLLDIRANSPATVEYIEQHGGAMPPGVSINQIFLTTVRK